VDGFMSSADKTKLDGVAANANNYTLPAATDTVLGGIELGSATVQVSMANPPTASAGSRCRTRARRWRFCSRALAPA
jgi:hypothetical protein